jgi:hypothetical protein
MKALVRKANLRNLGVRSAYLDEISLKTTETDVIAHVTSQAILGGLRSLSLRLPVGRNPSCHAGPFRRVEQAGTRCWTRSLTRSAETDVLWIMATPHSLAGKEAETVPVKASAKQCVLARSGCRRRDA